MDEEEAEKRGDQFCNVDLDLDLVDGGVAHVDERKSTTVAADREKEAEYFCCLLQPASLESDPKYIGVRRILLYRKALSGADRRQDWRCNGKSYVAYRNYIRRPSNWEKKLTPSHSSSHGDSGRWASPLSHSILNEVDSWNSSRELLALNHAPSQSASLTSALSESGHAARFVQPAYSFVGMHCIFDACKVSVTVLKFGHMSSDLLAYGASDGSLTICSVASPSNILQQLKGHSKDITDFDFTSNNQYVASSSIDKTVRIWEISKGNCIRVIYGVAPQLCIRFHPVNNNFLSVGNSSKEITVINFSTGRIISKSSFENEITSMDHDHTGQLIFAGDSQACVHSVKMNSHTGALSRTHRYRSNGKSKSQVTTVQFRTFSLATKGPVLLTCTQGGTISFYSVALEVNGYLTLLCSLRVAPRMHCIRASFCPLLSLEKGEFIVSGSEDSSVYFYDLTKPKNACVNKLQGHCSPVIGVAWNHGENLLASSDCDGTVIVWKRAKNGK